ncbi:MAG: hypothetical protein ACRBDX_01755 [Gammaproteobacteria bacterium]
MRSKGIKFREYDIEKMQTLKENIKD